MTATPPDGSGYWYPDGGDVLEMLEALRRFRRSDQEMRRRAAAGMDMNVTDMQALQIVIAAERRGEPAAPSMLARELGISTASTTKLLNRLTASGHLVRRSHPRDRRSVTLAATEHAHREVRERLDRMHAEMAHIAEAVPAGSRRHVSGFLRAMADQLDKEGEVAPLAPVRPAREGHDGVGGHGATEDGTEH